MTRSSIVVALLLLAAFIGLFFPMISRQRENADRQTCLLHLKRIGDGIQTYSDTTGKEVKSHKLPPAWIPDRFATWSVFAGQFIRQGSLTQWDGQLGFADQREDVRTDIVPEYFCPARQRPSKLWREEIPGALGDYAACTGDGNGPNGAIIAAQVNEPEAKRLDSWSSQTSWESLERGRSHTLLIGEKHVPLGGLGKLAEGDGAIYDGRNPVACARPAGPKYPLAANPSTPYGEQFGSWHPDASAFLMADLSARFFRVGMDATVLGKMAKRE